MLIFFLNINVSYAQNTLLDSLKISLTTTPQLLVKVDSKFSFVSNQLVTMRGIKAGANFNNIFKTGIGYSWMKNNFTFDNPTNLINDSLYDLKYSYISIFGDYRFLKRSNWTVLFNTDLAVVKLGYKNKEERVFDFHSYGFVVEPSLISEYRFLKYFVVGSGFGYRFVLREQRQVVEKFSAPIFLMRFKIDIPLLYKSYLKKAKE